MTCSNIHELQHTATHCNTLQQTATRCNVLQRVESIPVYQAAPYVMTCSNTICTATHCNTLQHTATHCNTYTTTPCNSSLYEGLLSIALSCSALQCVEDPLMCSKNINFFWKQTCSLVLIYMYIYIYIYVYVVGETDLKYIYV